MQKWEYCLLKIHEFNEVWVITSGGRKEKIKGKDVYPFIIISQYGKDGWEAVNFDSMLLKKESYNLWPKEPIHLLLKRPLED